jgi:chromosomal replication initiation ATPase DnaA
VIITIDILKKINGSIASGKFLTMGEIAQECCLDEKVLEVVAGDLNSNISSMNKFLKTVDAYLIETQKRVKVLSECYNAIQKLQVSHGIIKKGASDPPIIW